MKRTSQKFRLLAHLAKGEAITPLSALVNFGVARLAARIEELRVDHNFAHIETNMKSFNGKRYASYIMACPICCARAQKVLSQVGG